MNETGKVVKISDGEVTVQFERKSACDKCGMCFATDNLKKMELTLKNDIGAKIGDTVKVESTSSGVLSSLLIIYGVPLLLFLAGLLIAHLAFRNDLVTAITGVLCLVGGFFVLKAIDNKIGKTKRKAILPKIVSIENINDEETKKSEKYIAQLEKEIIE